uniref:Uncharacterized protein n=1 Tax=Anguilla anguilla TaxID=7936 RepID=A0A0E9XSD5_ANGAN
MFKFIFTISGFLLHLLEATHCITHLNNKALKNNMTESRVLMKTVLYLLYSLHEYSLSFIFSI